MNCHAAELLEVAKVSVFVALDDWIRSPLALLQRCASEPGVVSAQATIEQVALSPSGQYRGHCHGELYLCARLDAPHVDAYVNVRQWWSPKAVGDEVLLAFESGLRRHALGLSERGVAVVRILVTDERSRTTCPLDLHRLRTLLQRGWDRDGSASCELAMSIGRSRQEKELQRAARVSSGRAQARSAT